MIHHEKLVSLWYKVSTQPIAKCFGYKKGKNVDVDAISDPFVTKSKKNLVDNYG